MNPKIVYRILRVALITSLLWAAPLTPVFAGGVVGTGTPESCTEAALNAALAGGGIITFNCGAAPHTFQFSGPKTIVDDTTIDGGGMITLDGQDTTRLFEVSSGAALILQNIVLTNGFSSGNGGAIHNGSSGSDMPGSVMLENSTIRNSRSGQSGGAIVSTGPLTITNSLLENNQALNGGALYPRFAGARTTIISSTLRYNKATDTTNGWGGALLVWDGAAATIQDSDIFSNTAKSGGGIYAFANSSLALNNDALHSNSATNSGGGLLNAGTAGLTSMTITSNTAPNGGGLYNGGSVLLTNVTLSRNSGTNDGGGLYNEGTATLTSVTFSGNSAGDYGGGLYIVSGTATLNNVTLNGNKSSYLGGGLFNDSLGTATLINVTVSGNSAVTNGGGLLNGGTVTLLNVTISGNTAYYGGGINNSFGRAALINVTLSGNSASKLGGGIFNSSSATVTLKNSIVAYSPTGGNCGGGALTNNNSDQYSLSSDSTCALGGPGSQNNIDPLLMALGNYGGSTQVHMPKLGSPAIDGVSGSDAPTTDQRGKPRPQGGGYDIGAVERQPDDSDLAPRVYLPLVIK